MNVLIRDERPEDRSAVRSLNERAFGGRDEATIVEALHDAGVVLVSLVAEVDGTVAGHIAFSPVSVEPDGGGRIAGLAPMAVDPALQRQGIGSRLVREGLARCRVLGLDAVVVLGHPEYYPRFGFVPASRFDLGSEYHVPHEVFMAMELVAGGLADASGVVRFHQAFSA